MVLVLSLLLVTYSTQLANTLKELISTYSYHICLKGVKKEIKKSPAAITDEALSRISAVTTERANPEITAIAPTEITRETGLSRSVFSAASKPSHLTV